MKLDRQTTSLLAEVRFSPTPPARRESSSTVGPSSASVSSVLVRPLHLTAARAFSPRMSSSELPPDLALGRAFTRLLVLPACVFLASVDFIALVKSFFGLHNGVESNKIPL